MISLVIKLVTLPLLFFAFEWLVPSFHYEHGWVALVTIVILIGIGRPVEKLFLTRRTFWLILLLDFISNVSVIWLIALLFNQSTVTFSGALMISILITIAEYFVHRLLVAERRGTMNY